MALRKIGVFLIIAVFCAPAELISQPFSNSKEVTSYKYVLDSTLLSPPWNRTLVKDFEEDTGQTLFLKRILHGALLKYHTSLYDLEVNPEILFAAASEKQNNTNYFVSGGGANIRYQHKQSFIFKAGVVGFRQTGLLTDSVRTSNNLLQDVFYSQATPDGYKALDLRINTIYRPSQFFRINLGIDNQFAGDGYHSVIQGDQSPPHPFGRLSTSFWKIDYTVGYHFLKDVAWPDLSETYRKYMTTHQLNFRLHPKLHIYAWEAVVWKQEDTLTQRGFDLSYLNPVIFFRPVEFQLGAPSPDNVLLGLGFRWQPYKWMRFYGQVMFDEFYFKEISARDGWWANKYALQLGANAAFYPGTHYLHLRAEFNMARPFTYSHINSMQNYGSRFTPMAHPLGANFGELLTTLMWQWKRLGAIARIAYAQLGEDTHINYGQNIYRSYTTRETEYGHKWLQGDLKSGVSADVRFMYTINSKMELKLALGARKMTYYELNRDEFAEIYLRLSTFLPTGMKQLYRTK